MRSVNNITFFSKASSWLILCDCLHAAQCFWNCPQKCKLKRVLQDIGLLLLIENSCNRLSSPAKAFLSFSKYLVQLPSSYIGFINSYKNRPKHPIFYSARPRHERCVFWEFNWSYHQCFIHTHTHTHTHMYIYIYICIYIQRCFIKHHLLGL